MKKTPLILSAALLFTPAVFAQQMGTGKTDAAAKLNASDKQFVTDAAMTSLAEIEMGKLAQANGASQEVKDFGARLVSDHEKANRALTEAVMTYGTELPTLVDAAHQKHLDMLKAKTGAAFDVAFAKHMVEGHEKAIKTFKKEAASGQAPALKEFASTTLPTLEDHLKTAKELAKANPKTKTSAM